MATTGNGSDDTPYARGVFATTHWSVVLASQEGASTESDAALDRLCRTYWRPLYAFVRRRGYAAHDAQDLTQEFFARLLAKDFLCTVNRSKGKFRCWPRRWVRRRGHRSERRQRSGAVLQTQLALLSGARRRRGEDR